MSAAQSVERYLVASTETLNCEQNKLIDDDLTIVSQHLTNMKRKIHECKPVKQQEQQTHWAPWNLETTPKKELQLMQEIQISIKKLENSQFFTNFLDQIRTPEALDCFRKVTESGKKLKMVVYGIGSIESCDGPQLQLSLAILMKRNLDWIGEMEVFDPIISLTEFKVMEELGFRVLTINEEAKRQVVEPILFFMPFCHVSLYDNLLETNWRHDMLNRIILIGTSFDYYEQLVSRHLLNDATEHLIAIKPFTKEFKIGTLTYDYTEAFECMSMHLNDATGDLIGLQLPKKIGTISCEYNEAFERLSWHFFSVNPETKLEFTS